MYRNIYIYIYIYVYIYITFKNTSKHTRKSILKTTFRETFTKTFANTFTDNFSCLTIRTSRFMSRVFQTKCVHKKEFVQVLADVFAEASINIFEKT